VWRGAASKIRKDFFLRHLAERGQRPVHHCPSKARPSAPRWRSPSNNALRDRAEHLHFPIGAAPEVALRWLLRLGLEDLRDRLPAALSLGQQRRVALARALVRPAHLMLFDEPFSALDAPLRARLRRELRSLQGEMAVTTIVVTHDPEEAAFLADEMLVLDDGGVLQAGPVEAVFSERNGGSPAWRRGCG
jgi:ABC-type nitrate/sulfonate/bicarbonate transport system ATPase subunit